MSATFDFRPTREPDVKSALRIIVTSPPASGQDWLTRVLARTYDLDLLAGDTRPVGRRRGACRRRADGHFSEGAIYRTHSAYGRKLVDRWLDHPVHVVTIIRDPYDLFADLLQCLRPSVMAEIGQFSGRRGRLGLVDLALDDDPALGLLTGQFERVLRRSVRWSRDERVLAVRFEDLRDNPVRALSSLTDRIEPAEPARIEFALRASAPERRRSFSPPDVAAPGDTLSLDRLDAFRRWHADAIELLGYPIR